MSQGSLIWRVLGLLVLITVMAIGGFFVYQAGYSQGAAVAPVGAEGAPAPAPMPYPYYGYHPGPWLGPWFFPFGCLIGFFLIFLFFAGMKMLFSPRWYGGRHWHHRGYGPWGGPWEEDERGQKPPQGPGETGQTRTA